MLKYLILVVAVLTTSLAIVQSANAQASILLNQSDIDLINSAIKDKRHGITLVAEMTGYNLKEIKKYLKGGVFIDRMVDDNNKDISDSIKLSLQDKKAIDKRLKELKKFKWTETDAKKLNLDGVSLISFDSSVSNNLTYAIKYTIVPPIFFQNNQYCILSFSYNCGGLCGQGQITIYRKTEKGWVRWVDLTEWVD